MKACIAAGADAIYMGLPKFSARAYADNEAEGSYIDAIDYAHLHGVKLYCTVNTLFKERELEEELEETIRPLYQAGLDAVIVQDFGVMKRISSLFPDLPVHVSTQAAVTGRRTAVFLKRYHVTRIVPARELSFSEIRDLSEGSGLEIECFVHGALCYSYSGVCLFSSLAAGRSGNRGRCGQPCRLPYRVSEENGRSLSSPEEAYALSMKDLNTLKILPKIVDAGVTSLKIEGRMKKAEYAAGVTSIYRKYLDRFLRDEKAPYSVEGADEGHLFFLFNRQGFTSGYYEQHSGREMIALKEKEFRREEGSFLEYVRAEFIRREKETPVMIGYEVRRGLPVSLRIETMIDGRRFIYVLPETSSFIPDPAKTSETTKEEIEKQFSKTGGTGFSVLSIEGKADPGLFLPVGKMNELRRTALSGLKEAILKTYRRS